ASQYPVVQYYVASAKGDKYLCRCSTTVSGGTAISSSTKIEPIAPALQVTFQYSGKAAKSGGVVTGIVSTVTDLTTGLFDGQINILPSKVVLNPNISGAIFVNVDLVAKDRTGKQEYFSGAKLRNSVL
ncbi:MAG: hypothetical protein ABUL72_00210, partial [Armatimonadota bacterium]